MAAAAYARLRPHRHRYSRVVLLGPCHRVALRNLALSGADAFRTPLGDVPLDREAIAALDTPDVRSFEATHRLEHSLEVHLPFLQVALGPFSLVPLVVGDAAPETVAEVIKALWGGDETLIVVSSDLSHFLAYEQARARDRSTCEAIERLEEFFDREGLDELDPFRRPGHHPGSFARPRRFEIAAAINRLRSLSVNQRAAAR